jgi:hypothetical protein
MKMRFVAVGLFCVVLILLWATGIGPLAADVFLLVVDKLRLPTATLTTSAGAGYCREVYFTKGWGFPIDSDHPENDLQDEAAVSFVFRATKSKDQILIALRRSSNSLNQYSLRLDGNENPRLVSQSEWRDAAEILTPRGFWLDPPPAELQLDKFSFRSPDGRFAASGGYSGITQPGWFGDGRKGTMTVDLLQEGGGAKLVTMRGNFRKTGHQSRGFHPAHLNAFGGLNSRSRRVTPGTVLRDSLSDRTREERAFRRFKPLPPE